MNFGPEDDDELDEDIGDGGNDGHAQGDHDDDADLDDAGDQGGDDGRNVDPSQSADQGGRDGGRPADGAQPRVASRATRRVEEALERARQAEERAGRVEGQLNELLRGRTNETEAQERARVEAMDPWERSQYETDQRMRRIEQALGHVSTNSQDASDRAAFAALAASSPALRAVADRVEAERTKLMRQAPGTHIPRALVAQLLIGQDVMDGKKPSTRRPTSDRLERNRTAPSGARSDVGGASTRSTPDDAAARRKRLENQSI